jgi:hypothetical protein
MIGSPVNGFLKANNHKLHFLGIISDITSKSQEQSDGEQILP